MRLKDIKDKIAEIYERYAPIVDFVVIVSVVYIVFGLIGCNNVEYVEKSVYIRDTITNTILKRDSVHLHDSVWTVQYSKGDTIFVDSGKFTTLYMDKVTHDTVRIKFEVPVEVKSIEVVEKEKPLTRWQKLRLTLGDVSLGFVLLLIIAFVIKRART